MQHYKKILWHNIPVAQILDIISIYKPDCEQVSPLDNSTQVKIASMLNIDLSQCTWYKIMLVYMPVGKKLWIHSDKTIEVTAPGKLGQAIFLPLTSCKNLHWSWFECIDNSKIIYHGEEGNWKTIPMLPYDAATEVETVCGDSIMITDIGTWHSLRNESEVPEIALSIRLMPWSWEDFSTNTLPPIKL
jgi:hypothetical protein